MKKLSLHIEIAIRYTIIFILTFAYLHPFFLESMSILFLHLSNIYLNTFIETQLIDGALYLANNSVFYIVEECIAPSAYVLLTLLILGLHFNMKTLFDIYIRSILWFTLFNIIRIYILMAVHVNYGAEAFEALHLIFYEFLSAIVTVGIVFYYFKTRKIYGVYPIYSDVKYLMKFIKK